ncbi:MAG: polysaccharide deacetylase family protein [Sphingomonadales bacterium]|nr:polysaccharide deacetylase family protein [Sphingomonadales bacterium]
MLVLTYHSISDSGGPTSIPPSVFGMQMAALAAAGTVARHWRNSLNGMRDRAMKARDRRVLITFDDAFADFAEAAVPTLQQHGFSGLVFVPTQRLGRPESWDGANQPARPLMDWETVRRLAGEGMEFGGHSRTHADLTRLDPAASEGEIAGARPICQNGSEVRLIALQLPMAGFHPLSSKRFGGITALRSGPDWPLCGAKTTRRTCPGSKCTTSATPGHGAGFLTDIGAISGYGRGCAPLGQWQEAGLAESGLRYLLSPRARIVKAVR